MDTFRQLQAEATPVGIYGPVAPAHDGLEWIAVVAHDDESPVVAAFATEADAERFAAAPTHLADLITALEREAKVRELHKPYDFCGTPVCDACDYSYPCPTIRILDGNE